MMAFYIATFPKLIKMKKTHMPIVSMITWCVLLCFNSTLFAQSSETPSPQVSVSSGFLEDNMIVGDEVRYFLTARYPQHYTIIFPDSTYGFDPFEYDHKHYFPTRTRDSVSYDSVIYYLRSFEVDLIQTLQLPVYQLLKNDTITHLGNLDSIKLTELVTIPLDTIPTEALPLKWNVAYEQVKKLFNYPVAIVIVSGLILIGIILWILFWKKIRIFFTTRNLTKRHQRFIDQFNTELQKVDPNFPNSIEIPLYTWKYYLEDLEKKPYTKLTSKEWFALERDEQVYQQLQKIDHAIYGSLPEHHVIELLKNLKNIAEERYLKKVQHIKHG
jgi:hypothetical protein